MTGNKTFSDVFHFSAGFKHVRIFLNLIEGFFNQKDKRLDFFYCPRGFKKFNNLEIPITFGANLHLGSI
jgi:hypothetical protein